MADLISRQAAIDIVEFECGEWRGLAGTIVKAIEQLPSAQTEIIRCKDCKHYKDGECTNTFWGMCERDFCSEGERKEE